MRQLAKIAIVGAMLLAVAPAYAQEPIQQEQAQATNWPELLNDLYRLDLAIDRCDQVLPTGEEMIRLEDAIGYVERRVDMSKEALDEVFSKLEYETVADRNDFCAAMTNAVDEIRKIPAEYQD
ncbi:MULTISPECIES: hypothetical protein [unclassified Beijerinckia]|uniref:hypothetical protein n=1 Tax=unclassified Beijerinckia TaxID=2638183 RepID=UPI000896F215|nr:MULTISPECIES: hypothetical protein [unclassified Beijerinckia]MDH7799816.1 hypothetical protein [Beijerinckia sp. GAS462]SED38502.1 hypothetical protein SAMN05443249_5233 [Beijerinckia sp. 28-YEA-48]